MLVRGRKRSHMVSDKIIEDEEDMIRLEASAAIAPLYPTLSLSDNVTLWPILLVCADGPSVIRVFALVL